MDETPFSDPIDEAPVETDDHDSLLDRLRGTGVGVEDPNIVGDVGPTDIPPGPDPDTDGLFATDDDGQLVPADED
jgi:hypothetical protein